MQYTANDGYSTESIKATTTPSDDDVNDSSPSEVSSYSDSTESIKANTIPSDGDVNDKTSTTPSEVSSYSDFTESIKANTTPSDGDVNDKTSITPSKVSTYSTYTTPVLNEFGSQSTCIVQIAISLLTIHSIQLTEI